MNNKKTKVEPSTEKTAQRSLIASLHKEKKRSKLVRENAREVIHPPIPNQKKRKRIGRGHATGHGKTSGRGHKGQRARVGYSYRSGFEGGQTPLFRRLPKRGFHNPFKIKYQLVNLVDLQKVSSGADVDPAFLQEKGLISRQARPVKILGKGELKLKLNVLADAFSESAKLSIEKQGGKCEVRSQAPTVKLKSKIEKALASKKAGLEKRKEIRKYNIRRFQ